MNTIPAYLLHISIACVERIEALKLRGKKADDEAISYFCGAATGLAAAGHAHASQHVATLTGLVLSVRGFAEVKLLAKSQARAAS